MVNESVVNIDVANGSILADIVPTAQEGLHEIAESAFGASRWSTVGDCIIAVCREGSRDALTRSIDFLGKLVQLNEDQMFLNKMPMFVRVGVSLHNDGTSLWDVPPEKRGEFGAEALNRAGHLQKGCPVGGLAVSPEVYHSLFTTYKKMFRPSPFNSSFFLENRLLLPHEKRLVRSLTDRQKSALPALCFPSWPLIKPDPGQSLNDLRSLLRNELAVVLGDSTSNGPLGAAATSDAVVLTEALAALHPNSLYVGIDEWQDTAELVAKRDVLIVGSGATNMYSLVLNELFEPLRFVTLNGEAMDRIVAGPEASRTLFGRHAKHEDSTDAGLLLLSKSVFGKGRMLAWVAGITGMGTQAAALLLKDLLQERRCLPENAIGCVVTPRLQSGFGDISEYKSKWRVPGYEVIFSVDRDNNPL